MWCLGLLAFNEAFNDLTRKQKRRTKQFLHALRHLFHAALNCNSNFLSLDSENPVNDKVVDNDTVLWSAGNLEVLSLRGTNFSSSGLAVLVSEIANGTLHVCGHLVFLNQRFQPFSVMEDIQKSSSLTVLPSLYEQHPLSIDSELWLMAERRTEEILCTIEPVLASEQKRREVIDYIRRLIQGHFGTEVYPFGSVPLKTYLPHGDIDLTVLTYGNMEEDLARDVCYILTCAEQDPQFQVKDVHYVEAKVKIVKCSVNNIPVDISFNQVAGLCALCFLEQVDQVTGKDHLVKRSIILIKAWCFYESRILGAYHGLISTYAIEIMIVHIIDLFHSSLPGPLAVLWRFLDYYSTFDWDNYCVSINGPIAISSLRETAAGSPENTRNCFLLCQEFLQNFRERFLDPIEAPKNARLQFPVKHLNIMDPLKEGNNLGRSVSQANFHRIRCAFTLGTHSLTEIFMLPAESIGTELEKFFVNTLDWNGRGERPDAPTPVAAFGTGRSEVSDLCGDYAAGLQHSQWYHNYTLPVSLHPSTSSLPSQFQQKVSTGVLFEFAKCRQNAFSPRAMDALVPRTPFCCLYTWPLYVAPCDFDNAGRSQGTGTYIPDATRHHYRKKSSTSGTRKSCSQTCSRSLKSSQKIGLVEDALNTEKIRDGSCLDFSRDQVALEAEKNGNGNCLDLSLNQFPLLPFTEKPRPLEVQSCEQPIGNAPEDKDCTIVLEGIEVGTFRCSASSSKLPSSVAMEEAGSKGSTSWETMLAVPKVFMQMQQESVENDGQMVLGQQYQLENDKDFPPLRELKNDEDFPPLRELKNDKDFPPLCVLKNDDFPPLCKSSIRGRGIIPRTRR